LQYFTAVVLRRDGISSWNRRDSLQNFLTTVIVTRDRLKKRILMYNKRAGKILKASLITARAGELLQNWRFLC
jgi:hypothetical protein